MAIGGADAVIGAGRENALRAGARLAAVLDEAMPVAIVGVAGGIDPALRPGDLVVATELSTIDGSCRRVLPTAPLIAADLRRMGLGVRTGPIVSVPRFVRSKDRAGLAATGALAVDMESAWVMDRIPANPAAVVRAISDSADRGPVLGGVRALGSLLGVRSALGRWARAAGHHDVLLAAPRSFCAGVERAIEIVERALERYGPPVYVRRQIVHNTHVVRRLEALGAVFVEELAEVPEGATVILAAHGVSPEVRRHAAERTDLEVIDATCPLVAKVHHEARQYRASGHRLVLIGHAGHEEVVGTLGEAPDRFHLVESPGDVARLDLDPGTPLAYLTQTTLATDETAEIVDALRARFPHIEGPRSDDICYATQNRQDAVRALAKRCELVLVVGSANSSNTLRLVEVARREGCRAELIEDASQLQLAWLDGARVIGLTAGASAPDLLVQEVLAALSSLGPTEVTELRTSEESVRFALPRKVR